MIVSTGKSDIHRACGQELNLQFSGKISSSSEKPEFCSYGLQLIEWSPATLSKIIYFT